MKEFIAKSILVLAGMLTLLAVSFMAYAFFEPDVLVGLLFVGIIVMSYAVAWSIDVLR